MNASLEAHATGPKAFNQLLPSVRSYFGRGDGNASFTRIQTLEWLMELFSLIILELSEWQFLVLRAPSMYLLPVFQRFWSWSVEA